jgi:asparagine N-glycosylation enzyme membrane subunit Stt3
MNAPGKRSKAKELLWLTVTIMCLVVAVHSTIINGFKEHWYFFALAFLAFLFYLLWRAIRRKADQ